MVTQVPFFYLLYRFQVDDAYARKFVLRVMNLPEDSTENHELNKEEVRTLRKKMEKESGEDPALYCGQKISDLKSVSRKKH